MDEVCLILSEQQKFGAARVARELFFAWLAVAVSVAAVLAAGLAGLIVAFCAVAALLIRRRAALLASVLRAEISVLYFRSRLELELGREVTEHCCAAEFSALKRVLRLSFDAVARFYDAVLLTDFCLSSRLLPPPRASRRGALLR